MTRRRYPAPPTLPMFVRPGLMPVAVLLEVGRDYLRSMGMAHEADTVLGSRVEPRDVETVIGRATAVWRAYDAAGATRWAAHARCCVELLQGATRRLGEAEEMVVEHEVPAVDELAEVRA